MDTVDQKFLRGYQVTDANGVVTFTTIDPGWYQGRTVHFHFKLCTRAGSDQGYQFTSQLYFGFGDGSRPEPAAIRRQGRAA